MIGDLLKSSSGSIPGIENTGLSFYQESRENGKKVTVENAFVTLTDGMSIYIPFWHIDTGKIGPCLLLLASQHGNEVQGSEVARRFMEICAKQLNLGSVILVPMANLPAIHKRRNSINLGPEEPISKARIEGQNMNLIWPGKRDGNDTERIAFSLTEAVIRYSNYLVDIHCCNHFTAAETLSVNDNENSFPMGEVTATRFINYTSTPKLDTASQLIRKNGGGAIEIELSGQFQMQEKQVQTGLNSMVNIAKLMGLIKGKPRVIQGKRAVRNADTSHEIKSPCNGLFVPATAREKGLSLAPDDHIDKGDLLGHIIHEKTLEEVPVISPVSGYLWQLGACHDSNCDQSLPAQHPYTEEGERVALVVTT